MLDDADQDAFLRWLKPKLEAISEADASELAEYILALVATTAEKDRIRADCFDNLGDFLHDHTTSFVEEVLTALEQKTFLPQDQAQGEATSTTQRQVKVELNERAPQPIPSAVSSDIKEHVPRGPRVLGVPPPNAPKGPAALRNLPTSFNESRRPSPTSVPGGSSGKRSRQNKRKYNAVEREKSEPIADQDPHYNRNDGISGRKKQVLQKNVHLPRDSPQEQDDIMARFVNTMRNMPDMPPPPSGALPAGFSNFMAFFAMAGAAALQFPDLQQLNPLNNNHLLPAAAAYRDHQYQTPSAVENSGAGSKKSDHRSYQNNDRLVIPKNQGVSPPKVSNDSGNTTLIIEEIPVEKLNDNDVLKFFSQYGNVEEVQIQAHRKLAIVKFADRESASRAWGSPKVVFDNRFVKVNWHVSKLDLIPTGSSEAIPYNGTAESQDPNEVRKRLAQAQSLFEERRRRQAEIDVRSEYVDREIAGLDLDMVALKRELAQFLTEDEVAADMDKILKDMKDMKDMKDKSAAASIGYAESRSVWGGREDYRGYSERGGLSYAPHPPRHGVGSRYLKLDHRPKRLAALNIRPGSETDKLLRSHLLDVPGCETFEPHPEKENALVLTFQERFQAEMFLDDSLKIPGIGRLELAWVPNDAFTGARDSGTPSSRRITSKSASAEPISQSDGGSKRSAIQRGASLQADVADGADEQL